MIRDIIEKETTFYYHRLETHYNPQLIHSAYMVDIGEMDESEFKNHYPNQYYGKVIKYFEDDMFSLSEHCRREYREVNGIDLSKDGIYIENFDSKLFAVVINGEIVLRLEK